MSIARKDNCQRRFNLSGILANVTPLQRYIAEEIATDHVDGLLSRREALRRLALLGVSTAAATALIAACSESNKNSKPTANAPVTSSGACDLQRGAAGNGEGAAHHADHLGRAAG